MRKLRRGKEGLFLINKSKLALTFKTVSDPSYSVIRVVELFGR